MLILFGDKIRSQTKPFLYLFQLVAAKDPVHELMLGVRFGAIFHSIMLMGALFPKSTIKPQLPQPQVTATLGAF